MFCDSVKYINTSKSFIPFYLIVFIFCSTGKVYRGNMANKFRCVKCSLLKYPGDFGVTGDVKSNEACIACKLDQQVVVLCKDVKQDREFFKEKIRELEREVKALRDIVNKSNAHMMEIRDKINAEVKKGVEREVKNLRGEVINESKNENGGEPKTRLAEDQGYTLVKGRKAGNPKPNYVAEREIRLKNSFEALENEETGSIIIGDNTLKNQYKHLTKRGSGKAKNRTFIRTPGASLGYIEGQIKNLKVNREDSTLPK